MIVVVTSQNRDKLEAVAKASKTLFPSVEVEIVGKKGKSGINEQPEGYAETIRGAQNRMNSVEDGSEYDFVVSVENGIETIEIEGKAVTYDIGWVIVKDKQGNKAYAPSGGVVFNGSYVDQARKCGFHTTTVGSIIAASHFATSSSDSQALVTGGKVHRTELLELAIRTAWAQLLHNK